MMRRGVDRRVGAEGHAHQLRACVDLQHAVGLGQHAQPVGVEQRLALYRQLAEAVGDLFQQRVDVLGLLGRGQALVQAQPRVHVAAIGVGQQRGGMQVDLGGGAEGAQQVGLAPGLQRAHGLGQHVVVELEAHLHHVAALVLAQHLAGAADLQVVHRQVEARAQLLHLLDGLQAHRGLLGQALRSGTSR
jgi:hypothetical protein